MANTPFIDGDMVKDPTNRWLDLKISNKGSGLAIGIKWVLKVVGLTADEYIGHIGTIFTNPKVIDDLPVFSNTLSALSRDDKSYNLKGYIPPIGKNISCNDEKSNGSQIKYVLFLNYKKLMGRNNYHCVKIVFLSSGYKCLPHELPDCKEFDTESTAIKEWEESVKLSKDKYTL